RARAAAQGPPHWWRWSAADSARSPCSARSRDTLVADSCRASAATPPPRAERWGLPLFCDDRLQCLDVERLLGHNVLQPPVLVLDLLQPLQLTELHPAVLRL